MVRVDKDYVFEGPHGWTIPWYSSFGSDFNYDFHVTLDVEYNYTERRA